MAANPFNVVDLHGTHNQKSYGNWAKKLKAWAGGIGGKGGKGSALPEWRSLEKVGTLGGSTGARLMADGKGNRFVSKRGSSEGHLREEQAADEVYRAAKAPNPFSKEE